MINSHSHCRCIESVNNSNVIIYCMICVLQVTIEYVYEKGACVPQRVHTVVVSTQRKCKVHKKVFELVD